MDIGEARRRLDACVQPEWWERAHEMAATLASVTRLPQGLFLVGTPSRLPWDVLDHLHDVADSGGPASLRPIMVSGAGAVDPEPPHEYYRSARDAAASDAAGGVGWERLAGVAPGESVLVIADEPLPAVVVSALTLARRAHAYIAGVLGPTHNAAGLCEDVLPIAAIDDPRAEPAFLGVHGLLAALAPAVSLPIDPSGAADPVL